VARGTTTDDFVAIVELPEVSKNGLQIQAKENTIRIAGKLRCAAVARTNWRG
jgi:HSP20 family molecular chaperone IbpA